MIIADENNNPTPLNESNTSVISRAPIAANVRFIVALGVLVTQGLALLFCQNLLLSQSFILYYFAVAFTIFLSLFSSEWTRLHSFALTRQKRAFFDESNILETYQPRARTHGHLFQPDPPTPGPTVKFGSDTNVPEHSANEKAAFNAMRDAHYENMFEYAARVAKEAEEADRQALAAQKARLSAQKGSPSGGSGAAAAPDESSLPKGEPLYEDVPNNPPVNGPPSLDIGTKIELPPSLLDKTEKDSTTSRDKTTATTGTTATSTTGAISSPASTSVSSTPASATPNATSTTAKSDGQKRKKTKKI